jgi:hypothetical protein
MPNYKHLTGKRRAEQEFLLGDLDEHAVRPDFIDDTHLVDPDDLPDSGVPVPEDAAPADKVTAIGEETLAIDLTGSTANFDISNAESRTLTATLKRGTHTVTDDDTTVVTFAKSAGTGTVGGLGTAIVTDGVATKVVTSATQAAGAITITASAPGYASDTLTFTVVA